MTSDTTSTTHLMASTIRADTRERVNCETVLLLNERSKPFIQSGKNNGFC